jgi:hypothetical protein
MHKGYSWGIITEEGPLEALGREMKIILEWILNVLNGKARGTFIWFRMWTKGRHF